MCRLRKQRSCKLSACLPARVRKARDRRLTIALRRVQPRKRPALRPSRDPHHGNQLGGGFQTVQRSVASSTEGSAAGKTSKRLDVLDTVMLAIANERMDVCIGDPKVQTLKVGTAVALSVHALGGS
jgi:hypothetical protein